MKLLFLYITFAISLDSFSQEVIKIKSKDDEKSTIIVFETYFHNRIAIFKNDSLIVKKWIRNKNHKVLSFASSVTVNNMNHSDEITISVGMRKIKTRQYTPYLYVNRKRFTGKLSLRPSDEQKKYR